MKLTKKHNKRSKLVKRFSREDMRYLQKKISGRSVYRNLKAYYLRKPKHKNMEYQY